MDPPKQKPPNERGVDLLHSETNVIASTEKKYGYLKSWT